MAQYIECPNKYAYKAANTSIFLAGGITKCMDWQKIASDSLLDYYSHRGDIVILNPRRRHFEMSKEIEYEQINWEYDHFKKTDIALFWFPNETLCPITLFEYGKWLDGGQRPIFVGCDLLYERRRDIIIQTGFSRPLVKVRDNLDSILFDLKIHLGLK